MIKKAIHLFNPGYETAVLLGQDRYTPPSNVQVMRRDLSSLPLWYAEPDDAVWCAAPIEANAYASLPDALRPKAKAFTTHTTSLIASAADSWQAQPWGLSPDSLCQFARLAEQASLPITSTDWKPAYRRLTGRQTAALCLASLQTLLPAYPLPSPPCFCDSLQGVEAALRRLEVPCVLKTPYSSSGRGLLWCKPTLEPKERAWVVGALRRQQAVSVEQGLDKLLDFAMEFRIEPSGEVAYEGLSLFQTAERGTYVGNRLAEEAALHRQLTARVGESLFEQVRQALTQLLKLHYASHYQGYVGIDMLLYRDAAGNEAWHPCVEINMRPTMGLVALKLTQRLLAQGATGLFCVDYQKEPGAALRLHQQAQEAHPLCFAEGRIQRGYFSLCPVSAESHYRAYLLLT